VATVTAALLGVATWYGFGRIQPAIERQLASIERGRNADFPIRIRHPAEQEATAQAIALTLRQWGFPVTREVLPDEFAIAVSKPSLVFGPAEGTRSAEWVAARVSHATYTQKVTANLNEELQIGPGAQILLGGRLQYLANLALPGYIGMPVSFQDRIAKGPLGPVMTIIPGGTFLLGSSTDTVGYEGPTPTVTIRQSFAISQREITVDDYAHPGGEECRRRL
jgi:formylglycine-generating enzyme required for sulfatase activity